jgi:hypothetical protein
MRDINFLTVVFFRMSGSSQESYLISKVRLLCESKECRNEQKGKGGKLIETVNG